MTFRLAIITDVHADVHALRDALAQIERLACDQIVCAGDLIDWGLFPEETLSLLRERRIPCVRGNHDRWALQEGQDMSGWDLTDRSVWFLESLPETWSKTIEGVRVVVWHARPGSDEKGIHADAKARDLERMLDEAHADVLIVGHTHQPFVRAVAGGRLVLNPGALLRAPADPEAVDSPGLFGVLELPSRRVGWELRGLRQRLLLFDASLWAPPTSSKRTSLCDSPITTGVHFSI